MILALVYLLKIILTDAQNVKVMSTRNYSLGFELLGKLPLSCHEKLAICNCYKEFAALHF
jgi:hypothetical protein